MADFKTALKTAAVMLLLAMATPGAGEHTAWFGLGTPPPVSDPRAPIMKYDDVFPPTPTHFVHRPGESDELDKLLGAKALKADQKTIVGFSLASLAAGDTVWGRRAATPSFRQTIEWTVAQFKAAGLSDARVETFGVPGTMWVPMSWRVELVGDPSFGAGTAPVILQSAFPQPGGVTTPTDGVTAPLVFVGHGTDADLAGRDVTGKIAVVHVRPEPSLFGAAEQGVAARLAEKGAVAVINAIEGPGNAQYFDTRFACAKKPCFIVGGQDAWFLQQVIGKAANAGALDRLKARISLVAGERGDVVSANGLATIPGQSSRRIIINAHADGYFQAGDDNASGLAVLVGLARYFARQPKPAHTLMFVASGGHHGPGNGPAALVAAHPELKDGTLFILNLEHVAYADVVRGKVRATNNIGMSWELSVTEAAKAVGVTNESPFLIDLWSYASRCFGVATYQSVGPTVSGDLGGYRPLGVPMTQMIQSGTFYHSSGDVYEAVPAEGMERAARFHAFLVEEADRAPEHLISSGKGTAYTPRQNACP